MACFDDGMYWLIGPSAAANVVEMVDEEHALADPNIAAGLAEWLSEADLDAVIDEL